jgi:hypothetical protein
MDIIEDLEIGQVVATLGNQITVPEKHEYYDAKIRERVETPNIHIRLYPSCNDEYKTEWHINTNSHHQSGLVCFLPNKYAGYGILSVKIKQLNEKSVIAEPVEYIEFTGEAKLDIADIGRNASEVFGSFLNSILGNGKAIWHNKER